MMGFISIVTGQSYDDPKCVIDSSLPATYTNYIDCTSPVMVEMGKTECCEIESEKGCCVPGGSMKKMELIGICLAAVTAGLAALCVYCFWCRKNEKVAKAQDAVARKYHRLQEKCSCLACCRRSVERRQKLEALKLQAKEVPALELPAESNNEDPTIDRFWVGPLVRSK
ncbi:uncharacterized protein LOC128230939 [Mya arenaria]|uniref:uncharacterized protein LOC128230939 n=1 Tax=Mya arenaria TaxID=6604 RepID=UPI0022E892D9|nr:uncharacterized protein LOC128230939 [Mya arenaria]